MSDLTAWKDSGDYGRFSREIVSEDGERAICHVRTRQSGYGYGDEPWLQGEANFRLILKAPQMLEALEAIAGLAWRLKNITYKVTREDWETVEGYARAAIGRAKRESDKLD